MPTAAICVDARSMRGTGAESSTAPEGKNSRPNTECRTSVDMWCNAIAYCCSTIKFEDSSLASPCNCNAAHRASRRSMTCNHSAGDDPAGGPTPVHPHTPETEDGAPVHRMHTGNIILAIGSHAVRAPVSPAEINI